MKKTWENKNNDMKIFRYERKLSIHIYFLYDFTFIIMENVDNNHNERVKEEQEQGEG